MFLQNRPPELRIAESILGRDAPIRERVFETVLIRSTTSFPEKKATHGPL